jgi:hypothetical protein
LEPQTFSWKESVYITMRHLVRIIGWLLNDELERMWM